MSNDKSPKFYAYKCFHPVSTIHWAACPHCRHGRGQVRSKDGNGWTALDGHDEIDVIVLVQTGEFRFCGWCCRDLRDRRSA